MNKEISKIFKEIIQLLEIKGDKALGYKLKAYKIAINILDNLKIDEYIKHKKVKEFDELEEETAIRQVITHFFQSKGLSLQELKENAKKRNIVYSRFTKPAKQLLDLAGSVEKAKQAIDKVASWANTRKLDYAIETVFKKWLELDRLKPKEIVKKPFYKGDPMIWSETKKKWFVISKYGEWLEYAGKKEEIEWKIIE